MTIDADAVADCVLSTFDQLPEKRKPRPRNDASREWVPLAGIVLSHIAYNHDSGEDGQLSCVSLGTGMKCLPASKLPLAHGNVLHDWHAEVVAIRAFNRFLLDECLLISTPPYPTSQWILRTPSHEKTDLETTTSPGEPDHETSSHGQPPQETHPFALRPNVQIHMYCSEAPCGDASMELVMAAQDDATPWSTLPATAPSHFPNEVGGEGERQGNAEIPALRGRANFSHLGLVRLKPSRPDAPPTASKSCSDKLALTQCLSLLSSIPSTLIAPRTTYLSSLILPASQFVASACERAFSRTGRMSRVSDAGWKEGYAWRPFDVKTTTREFGWSRRRVGERKAVPSNLAAVWTPGWQETLIGGVLQGRKQFDVRGASRICRRGVWGAGVRVAECVGVGVLGGRRYGDVKGDEGLEERRRIKKEVVRTGLQGWRRNEGDDGFGLNGAENVS